MQDYQNRSKNKKIEASVKNGASAFAKAEVFNAGDSCCGADKINYGKRKEDYNKSDNCVS